MFKKKDVKKLSLNRQTLRALTAKELQKVGGGWISGACPSSESPDLYTCNPLVSECNQMAVTYEICNP